MIIIARATTMDGDTLVRISPSRCPEKEVSRPSFFIALTADPKNITALLTGPIIFGDKIRDRLLSTDFGGDGEVPGDTKFPGVGLEMRRVPFSQQALPAKSLCGRKLLAS